MQTPKRFPWEITRNEFAQAIYDELKALYPDAEENALQDSVALRLPGWEKSLMERAMMGRIPDAVLDDYVRHFGLQALRSFRGMYEKGAAGYLPFDQRYLTITEAARHLHVTEGRISQLKAEGKLTYEYPLDGRSPRVTYDSLLAYQNNKK